MPEVADDPRVDERSGTTVRGLTADDLGGPADLVVADLSFISLTLVMGDLAGLAAARTPTCVVLVKPQFEVGRGRLNGQGVVSRPQGPHAGPRARSSRRWGSTACTCTASGPARSAGRAGNTEYLLWARSVPSDTMSQDRVRDAVRATTTHPCERRTTMTTRRRAASCS